MTDFSNISSTTETISPNETFSWNAETPSGNPLDVFAFLNDTRMGGVSAGQAVGLSAGLSAEQAARLSAGEVDGSPVSGVAAASVREVAVVGEMIMRESSTVKEMAFDQEKDEKGGRGSVVVAEVGRTLGAVINGSSVEKPWWEDEDSDRPTYVIPDWIHNVILAMLLFIFVSGVFLNVK